jgi:hypothetical protein
MHFVDTMLIEQGVENIIRSACNPASYLPFIWATKPRIFSAICSDVMA